MNVVLCLDIFQQLAIQGLTYDRNGRQNVMLIFLFVSMDYLILINMIIELVGFRGDEIFDDEMICFSL